MCLKAFRKDFDQLFDQTGTGVGGASAAVLTNQSGEMRAEGQQEDQRPSQAAMMREDSWKTNAMSSEVM